MSIIFLEKPIVDTVKETLLELVVSPPDNLRLYFGYRFILLQNFAACIR